MDARNYERFFALSDMYKLLGCFVVQPTLELARALHSGALGEDIRSILTDLQYAEDAVAIMTEPLEDARREFACEDDLFHAVRRDYTHLFSNPTFSAMTLFESRMSGPDKDARGNQIFFGRTVPSARSLYSRAGFESAIMPRLREDHVAVELEFMQLLRQNQGVTLRDGNAQAFGEISRTVDEFASKHIGRWSALFFEDVQTHAHEGVYRTIGRVGARFMGDEFASERTRAIA